MTLRSRATEIPALVRRLGSRRQSEVDGARARLSIVGARAVEALIQALEDGNDRIRSHAMPILALIQDPRGLEPLVAMLLDRDARMREIAARCLARFPSRHAVGALERLLKNEKSRDVRVAAVQALLAQYDAGQEQAIRMVLALLFDGEEDTRVRGSAFPVLALVPPNDRKNLLKRLRQDPAPEISQKAAGFEERREAEGRREAATLRALLRDLASDDYAVWNDALHGLCSRGAPAVRPLIEEMQHRAHDPEYCARAGMTLKAMGPRRARALAEFLDRVAEPVPLQILVDVAGAMGEKSVLYRLKDLIDRIARRPSRFPPNNGFDPMQRVRSKAHLELARIGSRVAVEDMRKILSDPEQRLELEILEAIRRIGARDEIPDLLRAYRREDRFMKDRIADALRAIVKRERIRKNSTAFQALGGEERRLLDAILRPPRRATGTRARSQARFLS
jgi:HEAT repeat protein